MKTDSNLREVGEECFNNFYQHFNQEFQRLTFSLKSDSVLPKKVFERIKSKLFALSRRWESGQNQGVASEFWRLVATSRKFLKNL